MNEIWQALAREAGLAAEHIAMGASALGNASYSQTAYYSQAFFALSIGMERSAKLALVVDHALAHGGAFPPKEFLKKGYGHDIKQLLDRVDVVASQRGVDSAELMPRGPIHDAIVDVLSLFATNVTRYYNLDLITNGTSGTAGHDPIRSWFDRVIVPVLEEHYRHHHRARHARNATVIAALLEGKAMVLHHAERGAVLDSVYEASMQTAITEFAKPYTRMYVLQIARFLARVMSALTFESHRLRIEVIPHVSEFYAIFNNDDDYFRRRKTWSIHGVR